MNNKQCIDKKCSQETWRSTLAAQDSQEVNKTDTGQTNLASSHQGNGTLFDQRFWAHHKLKE